MEFDLFNMIGFLCLFSFRKSLLVLSHVSRCLVVLDMSFQICDTLEFHMFFILDLIQSFLVTFLIGSEIYNLL